MPIGRFFTCVRKWVERRSGNAALPCRVYGVLSFGNAGSVLRDHGGVERGRQRTMAELLSGQRIYGEFRVF